MQMGSQTARDVGGYQRLMFGAPVGTCGPAIFLDRDGVINERVFGGYVTEWQEFEFVRGMIDALRQLSSFGLPMIVVSNQACVGKGIVAVATLESMTRKFVASLARAGIRIDAVYYCPHLVEQGCRCRKPRSGLLEVAARDWNVDLERSVFIGDSESDVAAARAVKCKPILLSATGPQQVRESCSAIVAEPSKLVMAARQLLGEMA